VLSKEGEAIEEMSINGVGYGGPDFAPSDLKLRTCVVGCIVCKMYRITLLIQAY